MSFSKNDLVWMDSGCGYATPAVVLETDPLVVYNELTNCNFTIKNSTRLTHRSEFDRMAENLCDISDEKAESLLDILYTRFENNRFYTFNGPVLLSVNPNENLSIYDDSVMKQYKTKDPSSLPCHPFAIAQRAYANVRNGSSQEFILFSGESGSGKSTNVLHTMKYLSYMSSRIDVENIENVQDVLSAFSKAKTQKNENATRTGLCVDFFYGSGEGADGLRIRQVLPLDLFRLVEQKLGERNYNVFYQMCAGMSQQEKTKYGIKDAKKFFYLNQGKCDSNEELEAEKFRDLKKAMQNITFSADQQEMIFALLSAILHIGNLYFVSLKCVNGDEVADVGNEAELKWVALLLDLTVEQCKNMFLKKKDRVTNQPTSVTVEQALDLRDAIAQTIYEKLFSWILLQISKRFESDASRTITVFDCYGFERFNKNGFAEFCINAVNERLEGVYINRLFKADLSLIESEGVSAGFTLSSQSDNIDVLECLAKKPNGIIPLLSNECKFPKTSDATFLQSCNVNLLDKTCYHKARSKERLEFGLTHHAGTTWYHLENFIMKNQRFVSTLALKTLTCSQNTFIAGLFDLECNAVEKTVYLADHFYECAMELAKVLVKHNCQFVRCMRSNNHSLIGKFDHQTVARQLHALLVSSTSKAIKQGFPHKIPLQNFANRYRCILPFEAIQNTKVDGVVRDILDAQGVKFSNDFQIGRTLVFLRQMLFEQLERTQSIIVNRAAIVIQANLRAYCGNLKFQRKKRALTVLQAAIRGWKTRKTIAKIRDEHLEKIRIEAKSPLMSPTLVAKPPTITPKEKDNSLWATRMVGTYVRHHLVPKTPNIDLQTIEEFANENFKNHILESRREPIFTPFLLKESDESAEKSLQIFKLILKYTIGDGLSQDALHELSSQIMQMGIDDLNQRDEIYVQICNQTYKCRDKAVANKAWRLMLTAVNSFPPSIHILAMILHYFQSQPKQLSTLLLGGLLNRVRNIQVGSSRQFALTRLEDVSISKCLSPVVNVHFSDGAVVNAEVDSWETVGELAKRTLKERGVCDQEGWSLSLQCDERLLYADSDCFFFDAVKYLESKREDPFSFYTIKTPFARKLEEDSVDHSSPLINYHPGMDQTLEERILSHNGTTERTTPLQHGYGAPRSNYSTMTNKIRNAKIPSRNSDVDKFFDEVFDQILTPSDYADMSPAMLASTIKGGPNSEGASRVDLNDSSVNRTMDSTYMPPGSYVSYQPVVMMPTDFRMYMSPTHPMTAVQDVGRCSRLTPISGFVPAVVHPVVPQNMAVCMSPEGHSSPRTMYRPMPSMDPSMFYNTMPNYQGSNLNESMDESKQSVTMKINSQRHFTTSPTNTVENSRIGQICPTSPKARYVGIASPKDTTAESLQNTLPATQADNAGTLVHRMPKSNLNAMHDGVVARGLPRPDNLDLTGGSYYNATPRNRGDRDYAAMSENTYQQPQINDSFNTSQNFGNSGTYGTGTYGSVVDSPRGTRKQARLFRMPRQLYASGSEVAREDQPYAERCDAVGMAAGNYGSVQGYGDRSVREASLHTPYSTVKSTSVSSPMKVLARKLKSPTTPESLPPAVSLQNPTVHVTVRKDMFMPNEQVEAELDANLIYQQIIDDCKTHNIMKIRKHERDIVVHILTTNGIPPHMLDNPEEIPLNVKMNIIQTARSWPVYFGRLFEVSEERYGGSVPRILCIGESGLRILVADLANRVEPLRVQDHFEFIDLEHVHADAENELLRLHTKQDLAVDLRTPCALKIKRLIERFMCGETKTKYFVRATADYVTTEPGFLSFRKGDLIQITRDVNSSPTEKWLKGRIGNEYGQVSSDYVESSEVTYYGQGLADRTMPMAAETAYSVYTGDLYSSNHEPGKHTMMEFAMLYFRRPKNVVGSDALTLGRKKKEWTWKDIADKVKYSEQPINHSLLKIESAQADKIAQEAFVCIMRFMGDMNLKKNQTYTDCLYELLNVCHEYRPLRDEVYCQIIKQTTNNRSAKVDNVIRGWRLFSLLTAYFDCSEIMRPYLHKYLSDAAHDDRRPYHAIANVCLENIIKTFKYGGRKFLLNAVEVESITMGKPMQKQVYRLPGGHQKLLDTTSVTVAEEIIQQLCSEMNVLSVQEQQEFCLSCIAGRENTMKLLSSDEYILDVITELEQKNEEYFLMLKRTVWIHPLRLDNQLYIDMLFFQTVPEYLSGNLNNFSTNKIAAALLNDVLELAACLYLSDNYARNTQIKQSQLGGLVPPTLLRVHTMNGEQWVKRIVGAVSQMGEIGPLEAKAQFLTLLERWPLFGSAFFHVRQLVEHQPSVELLLSINKRGLRLCDLATQTRVTHVPFEQIKSTDKVICDRTHCLEITVADESHTQTIRLETESGGEISRLIGQYLFIGDEYQGTVIQQS